MRHSFVLLALFVAAAAPQARAQSQGGRSVPVLLEPFDISPNGAWRRRAAEVRDFRMQLLRSGNLTALNAAAGGPFRAPSLVAQGGVATAVTGTFHVPVIAIAYKDVDVPYAIADYQRILFSTNPGDRPYTIKTFYEQLTHNRITMDGVVFAPVHTDSVGAFYTDGCNGITVPGFTSCPARPINRVAVLMTAALDSISNRPGGDTVWSQFDNDGPDAIPNSGDDDGVVDFVTFLQPEMGGECRSNVPLPTGIWSHRYTIAGWTGQPYITKTPRRGPGGQPIPGEFIRVNDYTIQSEVGGITACDGSSIMAVGTVAHETGHAFGLPDLYDTRGSTQGIGGWGLMGSGNYARPYSPSSYDAWSLNALGWATVDILETSRVVTTGARLPSDTIYYARTNDLDEFVLVENRQAVLSDTAQMNPALSSQCPATLGFCAKSPGLLFWLIDQPRVQIGLSSNTVNVGALQGVELIQADGFNELRTSGARNRGDRGDSYPGSTNNTKLALLSNPSARDNSGDFLGFTIDAIEQLPQGVMRFRFNRRAPTVVQAASGARVRINGTAWGRYEEVVPAGDQLQLAVDDPQLIAGGKTRARFLAWSQGGPRDQLFTSSVSPDTLSALFAFEHRLTVITSGGGTVASSVAGDLTQGAFFPPGTRVTLTAATPTGFLFVGWRGDTVATAPTLELTLTRGYDLEARFILQVQVASVDAVSDLLGTPKLSDAQRVYLDELGNQNGTFDVGDLLALYRRIGLAVPPSLLQAAAAAATPRRIRERRP